MLNNKKNKNMYVPPSQAVGKKRGRGWTRTIDPLITNISRSATELPIHKPPIFTDWRLE